MNITKNYIDNDAYGNNNNNDDTDNEISIRITFSLIMMRNARIALSTAAIIRSGCACE